MLEDLDKQETLLALTSLFKKKVLEEFVLKVLPPLNEDSIECQRINGSWYASSWPVWDYSTEEGDDE